MTDKLADFMVEMATDDTLKKLYQKNPSKLMEIYNIEESDINLLLSKNYELVKKRLGTEYEINYNTHITAFCIKT